MKKITLIMLLTALSLGMGHAKDLKSSEIEKAVETDKTTIENPLGVSKENLISRCKVLRNNVLRKFKEHGVPTEKNPLLEQMEDQLAYLEQISDVDALALMAAGECKGLEMAASMYVAVDSPQQDKGSVLKPKRISKNPVTSDDDYRYPLRRDEVLNRDEGKAPSAPLMPSERYKREMGEMDR